MDTSMIQRSFLVFTGVAMCFTACGTSAPETIALADEQHDSAGAQAELVSLPAQSTPETVPPEAAPSSTSTSTTPENPAADGLCVRGADFPNFEGAVDVVNADMDQDGELDKVFLLADTNGLTTDGWVAVTFARGGIATGKFDGFFETSLAHDLRVVELTNGQGTAPEILFTKSSGPAISQVAVMTIVDCAIVTTTLFGNTFEYNVGTSAGFASSTGCAYGTGGRVEFEVTEQNPSVGDWMTTVYILEGSVWSRVGGYDYRDFPELDTSTVLTLTDCTGVVPAE